ncbi:uncharacterized protein At4g38062 [Abrus precatorius]|uniref:Uncharacterized protein At4g38062 n=1 Tax=Abrus precatorius TaxID=3816 RepID=A0A8B8KW61_ABRPR|nr:uncharacterized protein At4g38062 [Abrus precatorius]
MEKVYEELDEAKTEIERIKAELRAQTDSHENLKKSHNAQVNKIQSAKLKAEKLNQELLQKADELAEAKQVCEDLKGSLNKKESIIKHLSAANDKLRVDCDDKFKKWEDEKRGLVLALEEANEKANKQEQHIYLCRQEIESLKGCLAVSKKKCSETEKNLKASKELRERDDMFQKLEEETRKVEDQLKWKKEQFKHLEEAHEKLRDQFRSSKKELEMEKSMLLDEISSLQIKLDSQIRISEDLKHQLHACHQALAHVESQKKRLEVEVSDLKVQLDNTGNEYQDARFQLDCLNSHGDKDTADLRYSLKTKEACLKESKYRMAKLEQENRELRMSLKELQEAQIQEAGASYSQSKLRTKLKNLEQTHKECASTLKANEAEWNFKLAQLTADLNSCQSELESKIEAVEELQTELEGAHSLTIEMKLSNEEMDVMLLVLEQGIFEAQLKLASCKDEMDLINKEREENIFQLMKQLEMKDAALISAQKNINEERERATCLMMQVESYRSNEEKQRMLQNELDRLKEMLEESTMCQLNLKEKAKQMECQLEGQLKEVNVALDNAIFELDDTIYERNEMEFELQIWKSIVEHLKNNLEENQVMRKELETSLLAQVDVGESLKQEKDCLVYKLEEKERSLDSLLQRIVLLEHELRAKETLASTPARGESAVPSESDDIRYHQIMEEKDKILEELQKEVAQLEQESFRREYESAVTVKCSMESTYEYEKYNLMQLIKGKDMRIDELMQQVTSLEQKFTSSLTTFASQLAEKQAEVNLIQEACDQITASQILAALEIEEKKLMVVELEDEIHAIQQKLKLQEDKWSQSEQLALDTEVELDAKQLKVKELNDQMETELRKSDALLQKLKMENRNLLANATRLSSEREYLLAFVQGLSDKICEFSTADTQLMDMLRSMVESSENDCPGVNLEKDDGFFVKENMLIHFPTVKKHEAISDTRSPFKELNS